MSESIQPGLRVKVAASALPQFPGWADKRGTVVRRKRTDNAIVMVKWDHLKGLQAWADDGLAVSAPDDTPLANPKPKPTAKDRRKARRVRDNSNAEHRRLIRRAYDLTAASDPPTAARLIAALGGPWLGHYPQDIVKEAETIVAAHRLTTEPTAPRHKVVAGPRGADIEAYINGLTAVGVSRWQIAADALRAAVSVCAGTNGARATLSIIDSLRNEIAALLSPSSKDAGK